MAPPELLAAAAAPAAAAAAAAAAATPALGVSAISAPTVRLASQNSVSSSSTLPRGRVSTLRSSGGAPLLLLLLLLRASFQSHTWMRTVAGTPSSCSWALKAATGTKKDMGALRLLESEPRPEPAASAEREREEEEEEEEEEEAAAAALPPLPELPPAAAASPPLPPLRRGAVTQALL
jgi:hypothetical protein